MQESETSKVFGGGAGSHNYEDYGEYWFMDETSFEDDLSEVWGLKWGLSSEVGKLKAVLLKRPGIEIEKMDDPSFWRWGDKMNPEKARRQHDAMAEIYRKSGASVFYVDNARPDRPNAMFMRDNVLGTPEGAIVCRQSLRVRRGEEQPVEAALGKIGCPIVRTISGTAVFEGACAMWVNRETIIIGTGVRANMEGASQVEETLRRMGVKNFIHFQIPYGHAHLDGLMNFVDTNKALIFPWQTPYDVVKPLMDMGIEIINAPSVDEVKHHSAVNLVALEPGKVIMPAGCPITKRVLENHNVEVIEVDVDEIMKGYGSLHCMTGAIARDDI